MGPEEEGLPWSDRGLMLVEEVACCGRTLGVRRKKASRMVVTEGVSVLVAAEVVRLGLSEVGVAHLHVVDVAEGMHFPAVTGLGWEAGRQSDLLGVEGLEQRDWILAEEAGDPVCQVGVVVVQEL